MLTVPATVKALFQTDGTRKNFRAHFPNGEYSDITNADVVYESVKFTESICSQNVLRFGLTEASMIEFETVGVGNMMGMIIECGIEVDTTSLSAAQISAIEGSPGDGTLVKAADSDIGFGYYRIPYGVFMVASCPRNQQAMTHRRVQAYSLAQITDTLPALEEAKLASPGTQNSFPINLRKLAFSLMAAGGGTGVLTTNSFTRSLFADQSAFTVSRVNLSFQIRIGGVFKTLSVEVVGRAGSLATSVSSFTSPAQDNIFELDPGGSTTVFPQVVEWLETQGVEYAYAGYDSLEELVRDKIPECIANIEWKPITTLTVGSRGTPVEPGDVTYPYRGTNMAAVFTVPEGVGMNIVNTTISTNITPTSADQAAIYKWADGDPEAQTLSIVSTNSGKDGNKKKWYTFTGSYKPTELINSYLELHGLFEKVSRNGSFDLFSLDDANPIAIGPESTEEMWWDEYDVDPVGSILCTYGADKKIRISFNPSNSVYEITNNYVLAHLPNITEAQLQTLLSADLIPALKKVGFTPVELKMQGWPWIEAGDALQVTAEDGVDVDTFALEHTINGIQDLRASITSKGGEIIGGS